MASARMIEVRIKQVQSKNKKPTEPKNDIDSKLSIGDLLENKLFQSSLDNAKNLLTEGALYGINKHLELTDDYVSQRYLNAGMNVIGRAVSMGSSIVAGANVGGVVGAIIGAVFAVGDLAFDIFKNYDKQNILIKQLDAQLQYQRQRAGYSLTSGSIGENR